MSDHEEFPAFAGSGDPREEALWQAYQAMLRRRNERREERLAAEGPRSSPRRSPGSADPPPPPAHRGRTTPGRRAALGAAVVLAAGAALAVALWPPGAAPNDPMAPGERGNTPQARPGASLAPRPTLPCFVEGRPVARLTLDDCASRNGVASGPLYAAPAEPFAPRPSASPRGAVVSIPMAPMRPSAPDVAPPARHPYVAEAAPNPPAPFATRPYRERSAAPPSELEPTTSAKDSGYGRGPVELIPPKRASALAVREFYSALGEADGARASAVVVPEKREDGPLSAGELTRFYSSLRAPLRLTQIDPINDDTVFVRYQFVTSDNRLCSGSATVRTTHRNGDTLVRGIRASDGC